MPKARRSRKPISSLGLSFEVPDDRPDWPVVSIRVDDGDPFVGVAAEWRGFDPDEILGPQSPLLPRDLVGRRVALYRCSCGFAGDGVIAPVIMMSPDRRHVSWVDFRDYTGVFDKPVCNGVSDDGHAWDLPDLHFDYEQYEAEVTRAANDRTWETARRRTARLVKERLATTSDTLPGCALSWVSPAWSGEGVALMFEPVAGERDPSVRPQVLKLSSQHTEPDDAAKDIVDQLLSTFPNDWLRLFGWNPA